MNIEILKQRYKCLRGPIHFEIFTFFSFWTKKSFTLTHVNIYIYIYTLLSGSIYIYIYL